MATVSSSRSADGAGRELGRGQPALVLCGHSNAEEHSFDLGVGQLQLFTTPNPCDQKACQDALGVIRISPTQAVIAIADGAGGHRSGGKAAQIAIESVLDCVSNAVAQRRSMRDGILNGFDCANRDVRALGIGAATTLAVVEINGQKLRPYHVGDSSIMLIGQRGALKLQSVPHSPVGYAVASGMLEERAARSELESHLVSNMIGDEFMHVEMGSAIDIAQRDTLLGCCDGLTDNVETREIVKTVRSGPQSECMRKLSSLCLKRMREIDRARIAYPDDLSFFMFRLS